MKNIIVSLLLLACVFTLNSCQSKITGCTDSTATNYNPEANLDDGRCTYTPQGPLNPSFENSASWTGNYDYYSSLTGQIQFLTGTGFMPTKGSSFLDISWGNHRWDYTGSNWTGQVYQENVYFNSSSKLIFDYSFRGPGTANILFTSNGTASLWTNNISGTSAVQKTNETIILPHLPDKGKLIIQLIGMSANSSLQVDNIRVQ
ncbi:MAG: hypothetical protein NTZ69_18280 [Bacteroidia bacterium]|nr:hypothetical protein [Bacteroidia bacterium]